jgi:P4 family phage/plasmid primase-like protien
MIDFSNMTPEQRREWEELDADAIIITPDDRPWKRKNRTPLEAPSIKTEMEQGDMPMPLEAPKIEVKGLEPVMELDEATRRAQVEACVAVLEIELPRLLRVTPRLQLFCQHPKDALYALSGIFTDVEKAANVAIQVNLAGYNVNYLLNECTTDKPVTNELRSGKAMAVKNVDITHRRRLMLDVDPNKDEGESAATDTQLAYAEDVTVTILTELHEKHGIPIPVMHHSGNGVQSIWTLDAPMTPATDDVIKDFLKVCGKHSVAGKAKVDVGVHQRNQHAKLPGTFSRKGTNTPERPQRMARRLDSLRGLVADDRPLLTYDMMLVVVVANQEYLASIQERQTAVLKELSASGGRFQTGEEAKAKVEEFCDAFDLDIVKRETHHGDTEIWRLKQCPYQLDREGVNHKPTTNHAFIQIWVRGEREGTIGAGCKRGDCGEDIESSGFWAWDYMQRILSEEYAAKAEARDKWKAEQQRQDTLLENYSQRVKAAQENTASVKGAGEILASMDWEHLPSGVSNDIPEEVFSYQQEIERNDTGNGQLFAAYWGRDVIHVTPKGFDWYTWNGSLWVPDDGEKKVLTYAKETAARIKDQVARVKKPEPLKDDAPDTLKATYAAEMEEYKAQVDDIRAWSRTSGNLQRLTSMLKAAAAEPSIAVSYTQLDNHPYLLNVKNGVVDLRTAKIEEHKREHYMTTMCEYPYSPTAQCPNWERWLNAIFLGDQDLIRYYQWVCGEMVLGHNLEQHVYLFYGQGQNGKSTALDVAYEILGEAMVWRTDFEIMRNQEQSNNTRKDLAEMVGKRLVIISEGERGDTVAEGFLKRATGEKSITGERKYGRPFTVPVTFTMCAMTQHLPRIVGQDKGIWRRIRVVPFDYQIPDDEKDQNFIEHHFKREFAGILRWMVEGAMMHQDLTEEDVLPDRCRELLAQYKDNNDQFSEFVEDCLVVKEGAFITNEQLYAVAAEWGGKNRAPALVSSSKNNMVTMLQNCPLTQKVKEGRKNLSDGTRPRGFYGIELANRAAVRQIGKGGNDYQTLTKNRG